MQKSLFSTAGMNKKTFYRLDSLNHVQIWTIEVRPVFGGGDESGVIITTDGIENGKMTEVKTVVSEGKNIGKANETTALEQAVKDAQTEINKKVKQGYGEDRNNLKTKGETATIKAPMKGDTYWPGGKAVRKGTKSLKEAGIEGKMVGYERKLDGWRYRIKVDANNISFHTSSGDLTLSFPQIEAVVREVFDKNIGYWNKKYGITSYILDGEVYNHELGFQLTASACGAGKNKTSQSELDAEQKELRDQMQFHIFDMCLEDKNALHKTRKAITNYFVDNVWILPVETIIDVATEANVEKYMKQFLAEGYEGLMIRQLDMPYEFKRSKQLLKYKPLLDNEYKIVGFLKSIAEDRVGSIEFEDENGKTFSANPMGALGSHKVKREMWANQSEYIGKYATVQYLEYTDEGVPRHGRAKCLRAGKSKD